jgi:hypothetical protein
MNLLATAVIDLTLELDAVATPLTLGGGFGLYLKQRHLEAQEDLKTLIPSDLWPPARATEDVDLLLSTEVVVDVNQMRAIRRALDRRGFTASVEFMQFEKQTPLGPVKIDLLTGPVPHERRSRLKIKPPRVRPRQDVQLHAYLTPEAIAAEQGAILLPLSGVTSEGREATVVVRIPGAFTLLLMKLHAFRDRVNDERKQLAQHHALDLYRIVAMLTADEFDRVQVLAAENRSGTVVQAARNIVDEFFRTERSLGVLRLLGYMKERPAPQAGLGTEEFVDALRDLLGG